MTANTATEDVEQGAAGPRAALVRQVLAAVPVLVGAVVLLGWTFDVLALKSVAPGLTTMKANTALGLAGAGAGLLLLPGDTGRRWPTRRAGPARGLRCGGPAPGTADPCRIRRRRVARL